MPSLLCCSAALLARFKASIRTAADRAGYGLHRHEPLIFRRLSRVALHEICHMFGLGHCIFFKCLMNGTACLQENELRPPHLCPICLHKLQLCIGFDLVVRFQELRQPNPHFVFVRCDSIRAVPFALLVPAVCAFV
jgi:hypothetical protein